MGGGCGYLRSYPQALGRWTPTADQAYERTGRKNTLKSWGRQDPFDEALVRSAIAERMADLEYPDGAIQIQNEKLMVFGKLPVPKRIRLTEAGPYEEDGDEADAHQPLLALQEDEKSSEEDGLLGDVAASSDAKAEKSIPLEAYVLGIVGVGECHRAPGAREYIMLVLRWWAMTRHMPIRFTSHAPFVSQGAWLKEEMDPAKIGMMM